MPFKSPKLNAHPPGTSIESQHLLKFRRPSNDFYEGLMKDKYNSNESFVVKFINTKLA